MAKKTTAKTEKPAKPTKTKATPDTPKTPTIQVVQRPANMKGIEQLVYATVGSLAGNPANWKTHSERQLEMLRNDIGENSGDGIAGWAGALLYNLTTSRLIDGHGRQELYKNKPDTVVPVLVGRWTPEEEEYILEHLDPVGSMYTVQADRLRELTTRNQARIKDVVDLSQQQQSQLANFAETMLFTAATAELGDDSPIPDHRLYTGKHQDTFGTLNSMTESAETPITVDQLPTSIAGGKTLKTYLEMDPADWKGRGAYGVPMIRPDMVPFLRREDQTLPKVMPWVGPETAPLENPQDLYYFIYGSASIERIRTHAMIVSFYTVDYKFEPVWNDPTKFTARLLNMGVKAVTAPDFSVLETQPLAFNLWQTYRSRWLARYWQELGIPVIPNLMPLPNAVTNEELFEISMIGMPKETAFSVQVQASADAAKEGILAQWRASILKAKKYLQPRQILIYHSEAVNETFFHGMDTDCDIIRIPTWIQERRKILNSKEYIK